MTSNVTNAGTLTAADCSNLGIPLLWVGKRMNTVRLYTIRANVK